jgi:hypothetical protein
MIVKFGLASQEKKLGWAWIEKKGLETGEKYILDGSQFVLLIKYCWTASVV